MRPDDGPLRRRPPAADERGRELCRHPGRHGDRAPDHPARAVRLLANLVLANNPTPAHPIYHNANYDK